MLAGCQHQARLADAGRALEQQQRTSPSGRVANAPIDPGERGVSLQKCLPTIHGAPRRSMLPAAKFLGPPPQKQVVSPGAASTPPREPERKDRRPRTKLRRHL